MFDWRYARYICEPGGFAEKVHVDRMAAAESWRQACHVQAAAHFRRKCLLRMQPFHGYAVALLEGEAIPKGWKLVKSAPEKEAPYGMASCHREWRRLPNVPSGYDLARVVFGDEPMVHTPGGGQSYLGCPFWERLGDVLVLSILDPGHAPQAGHEGPKPLATPAGARRIRESEYWVLREAQEDGAGMDLLNARAELEERNAREYLAKLDGEAS